ncbi:MAG: fumarylacetoacetate hydrolase family protein [Desulfuromonadaceae bacterium]|nr:fumarylacetoacetate hydrolase family protein [Desulfuromonadaceae bacterium]
MHSIVLRGEPRPVRVGKILCLARNYVAHAEELGNEVPAEPVLFSKPASSIVGSRGNVVIPTCSQDCHHEVELAVLIGTVGKNVTSRRAMELVRGYAVAIDMTLRDIQAQLKSKGYPWDLAKGFDTSCPLSEFVPAVAIHDPHQLKLGLEVNAVVRQSGNTECMIHRIPDILAFVSRVFTLEPGDIILTGTPAGVGRVVPGDHIRAWIEGVGTLEVQVQ